MKKFLLNMGVVVCTPLHLFSEFISERFTQEKCRNTLVIIEIAGFAYFILTRAKYYTGTALRACFLLGCVAVLIYFSFLLFEILSTLVYAVLIYALMPFDKLYQFCYRKNCRYNPIYKCADDIKLKYKKSKKTRDSKREQSMFHQENLSYEEKILKENKEKKINNFQILD